MEINQQVKYWVVSAGEDYQTMQRNFNNKDYSWSLFIGHLVIEKLLKALYIKNTNEYPPRVHDLVRLANLAVVPASEEQKDILEAITQFNLECRYPDYNNDFRKKYTLEFTSPYVTKIKEMRKWLLSMID